MKYQIPSIRVRQEKKTVKVHIYKIQNRQSTKPEKTNANTSVRSLIQNGAHFCSFKARQTTRLSLPVFPCD